MMRTDSWWVVLVLVAAAACGCCVACRALRACFERCGDAQRRALLRDAPAAAAAATARFGLVASVLAWRAAAQRCSSSRSTPLPRYTRVPQRSPEE